MKNINLKNYFKPSFWAALILDLDLITCLFFFNNQQADLMTWRWGAPAALLFLVCLGLFYRILDRLIIPQSRKLGKRTLAGVLTACTVSSLFILTFATWPVKDTQVMVRHLKIRTAAENPVEVKLSRFKTNYGTIRLETFKADQGWKLVDENTFSSAVPLATLEWSGYAKDTVLVFRGSKAGGAVTVDWDGRTVTYDLTETDQKEIVVHDGHPVTWPEMLVTTSLSLQLMVFGLLGLISLLAVLSDKPNAYQTEAAPVSAHPPGRLWLDALWGLAGIGLFLWLTREVGLWVLSDSVDYLSAARHVLAGQGYVGMDNDLYIWWPPLLPGILALFHGGLNVGDMPAIRLFFILITGATLAVYSFVMRKMVGQGVWYWMGMGLLTVSVSFWTSVVTMMSEPVFLFFEAFFLLFLMKYIQTGRLQDLLRLVLVTGLLSLTRYAGGFFAAGLGLCLCFWGQGGWIKRLARAALAAGLSMIPMGLWIVRNYLTKGVLTGKRPPPESTPLENISGMLGVIGNWFQPFESWMAGLAFVLFLTIGCVTLWGRKKEPGASGKMGRALMVLIWVYMVSLMISFSSTNLAPLNGQRHYSPLFFPIVLLMMMILQQGIGRIRQVKIRRAAPALAGALLVIGFILSIQWLIKTGTKTPLNTEQSFSIYAYWGHPAIRVAENQAERIEGIPWASNCKKCLYYAGNRWAVEFYEPLLLKVKKPPLAVVWFYDLQDSRGYPADEAGMRAWLEQVHGPGLEIDLLEQKERGAVYRVQGKE